MNVIVLKCVLISFDKCYPRENSYLGNEINTLVNRKLKKLVTLVNEISAVVNEKLKKLVSELMRLMSWLMDKW